MRMASELLRIRPFRIAATRWETPRIFTLTLEPEKGEPMIAFVAGQWAHLHLLDDHGSSQARAAFSFATAPEECLERLEFGIKVYGTFTTRASKLRVGDRVGIQGSFGVFTLREENTHLVMIAGGIGVTPFRSMIRSLAAQECSRETTLIYSNKTIEDAAYAEEFVALAGKRSWFRFVPTCTATLEAARQGERGRVSLPMLRKHIPDFEQATFLACGPVPLMEGVRQLLIQAGVDVKDQLRTERFS